MAAHPVSSRPASLKTRCFVTKMQPGARSPGPRRERLRHGSTYSRAGSEAGAGASRERPSSRQSRGLIASERHGKLGLACSRAGNQATHAFQLPGGWGPGRYVTFPPPTRPWPCYSHDCPISVACVTSCCGAHRPVSRITVKGRSVRQNK